MKFSKTEAAAILSAYQQVSPDIRRQMGQIWDNRSRDGYEFVPQMQVPLHLVALNMNSSWFRDYLASISPQATFIIVPGSSHYLMLDAAKEINEIVLTRLTV